MTTQAYDSDTLIDIDAAARGGPAGKADFDVVIWNWGGDVDPNSLLDILTTTAIGAASDTFFSNPRYDELMKLQYEPSPIRSSARRTSTRCSRSCTTRRHITSSSTTTALHAYRTDKFGGWHLQPSADGLPFFGCGAINYTQLTAPEPEATPDTGRVGRGSCARCVGDPGTDGDRLDRRRLDTAHRRAGRPRPRRRRGRPPHATSADARATRKRSESGAFARHRGREPAAD